MVCTTSLYLQVGSKAVAAVEVANRLRRTGWLGATASASKLKCSHFIAWLRQRRHERPVETFRC
jgi:hypothetical protein